MKIDVMVDSLKWYEKDGKKKTVVQMRLPLENRPDFRGYPHLQQVFEGEIDVPLDDLIEAECTVMIFDGRPHLRITKFLR